VTKTHIIDIDVFIIIIIIYLTANGLSPGGSGYPRSEHKHSIVKLGGK
jgi:hypothetical protein